MKYNSKYFQPQCLINPIILDLLSDPVSKLWMFFMLYSIGKMFLCLWKMYVHFFMICSLNIWKCTNNKLCSQKAMHLNYFIPVHRTIVRISWKVSSNIFKKYMFRRCQWSTKNWRFEEWFNNTLKNNTIRCEKLATIVSGRKT